MTYFVYNLYIIRIGLTQDRDDIALFVPHNLEYPTVATQYWFDVEFENWFLIVSSVVNYINNVYEYY